MDMQIDSLAMDLMKAHPLKGGLPPVVKQLWEILYESTDRPATVAFIRESHARWLPQWRREIARRGDRAFIPLLYVWLRDGDYLTPPEAPAAPKQSSVAWCAECNIWPCVCDQQREAEMAEKRGRAK